MWKKFSDAEESTREGRKIQRVNCFGFWPSWPASVCQRRWLWITKWCLKKSFTRYRDEEPMTNSWPKVKQKMLLYHLTLGCWDANEDQRIKGADSIPNAMIYSCRIKSFSAGRKIFQNTLFWNTIIDFLGNAIVDLKNANDLQPAPKGFVEVSHFFGSAIY